MTALLGVGFEALLADKGVIDQMEEELVLLVLCLDFLAEIIEEAVEWSGRCRHGEDSPSDLRKTTHCQTYRKRERRGGEGGMITWSSGNANDHQN